VSFLIKRGGRAFSGWRDLDAEHLRPDEIPVQPPWRRTNLSRTVGLVAAGGVNELRIADYSETVFQVGGVSYERMALTNNWGAEFDLNIDGNILQLQYFGMVISPSWAKVGFSSLNDLPMITVWREVASASNSIKLIVYRGISTYDTLASTIEYGGLMNRSWYRLRIMVSLDHLVRVYYYSTLLMQYWLPNSLAPGPNRRALSFLNQTSAYSQMRNFRQGDYAPDYNILRPSQWAEVFADDFNRPDGAVDNGWTQLGTGAEIRSGSWTNIGTTNARRAIIRDTGNTNGVQRVEAVLGGFVDPTTVSASLVLRTNSTGDSGLLASFANGQITITRFTSSLGTGSLSGTTYVSTPDRGTLANNLGVAFCANGEFAWVEVNGVVVLMAQVSTAVVGQYAGAVVLRAGGIDSGSWNSVRLMEAAL